MRFIVSRTTMYEGQPCEEAFKMKVPYWHTRTCSEEVFNEKFSTSEGLWRSKGKNHSVTKDGYITRQEEDREEWGIEINSLEELLKFENKYGSVIISDYFYGNDEGLKEIEIYDGYRE